MEAQARRLRTPLTVLITGHWSWPPRMMGRQTVLSASEQYFYVGMGTFEFRAILLLNLEVATERWKPSFIWPLLRTAEMIGFFRWLLTTAAPSATLSDSVVTGRAYSIPTTVAFH